MKKGLLTCGLLALVACAYAQSTEPNVPQLGAMGHSTSTAVKPVAADPSTHVPQLGNTSSRQAAPQAPKEEAQAPNPNAPQKTAAPQLMEASPAELPKE
jgi:hypothetical protein